MSERIRQALVPLTVVAALAGTVACSSDNEPNRGAEVTNTALSPEEKHIRREERGRLSDYLEMVVPVYEQLYADLASQEASHPEEITTWSNKTADGADGTYTFRSVTFKPSDSPEALRVLQRVNNDGEITSTDVSTFIPGNETDDVTANGGTLLKQVSIRKHDDVDLLNHVIIFKEGRYFALGQSGDSFYKDISLDDLISFVSDFSNRVSELVESRPLSNEGLYEALLISEMQESAYSVFHTNTGDPNVEKTFVEPTGKDQGYYVTTKYRDTGETVQWRVQLAEGDSIDDMDFSNTESIEVLHTLPPAAREDGILVPAVRRLTLERTTNGDPKGAVDYFFIGTIDDPAQNITNFDSRVDGLAVPGMIVMGADKRRING